MLGLLHRDMTRQRDTASVDRLIYDLAARQHGVVSLRQLEAEGVPAHVVDHRVSIGRLAALHRGVYVAGSPVLTRRGELLAAVLACGNGAVLSYTSAGELWAIRPRAAKLLHVTVPVKGGRRQRPGLRVHRTRRPLPSWQSSQIDGIPVTSPSRTLLDLAEILPRRQLERAIDETHYLRLFDLRTLDQTIAACPGRTGGARLTRALAEHRVGTTRTRTTLEERFLRLCATHSIPRPLVNTRLEGFEVDFLWPQEHLVVETDGRQSHLTPRTFESDRERDAALAVAGYTVLRFTDRQMTRHPGRVAGQILSVLRRAAA